MSANGAGGAGGGGGMPVNAPAGGQVGAPEAVNAARRRAAGAAVAPARAEARTLYGDAADMFHSTGIPWALGWAVWSAAHPRQASDILMRKLAPTPEWEDLPEADITYVQDALSTRLLAMGAPLAPLARRRINAGIDARFADIDVALFAAAYKKKYAAGDPSLPVYAEQLVCAVIKDLRYNQTKDSLKAELIRVGAELPDRSNRALVRRSDSLAQRPALGGLVLSDIATMPWQLREFVKTFLEMEALERPVVAEIFDLGAVRGLVREAAQIPPIRNQDAADRFLAEFRRAPAAGPEILAIEAREMIAAAGEGGAGAGAAPVPRDLYAPLNRLAQVVEEEPAPKRARPEEKGGQGGGYRKTRRNKNKRKTRSKNRKSKNKSRSRSRSRF